MIKQFSNFKFQNVKHLDFDRLILFGIWDLELGISHAEREYWIFPYGQLLKI